MRILLDECVDESLRPLSFREIKRRLNAMGFAETRQKGSPVKSVRSLNDVVDTVIVPNQSEVPMGTLRSILSQANLDPDEWATWADFWSLVSRAC